MNIYENEETGSLVKKKKKKRKKEKNKTFLPAREFKDEYKI